LWGLSLCIKKEALAVHPLRKYNLNNIIAPSKR